MQPETLAEYTERLQREYIESAIVVCGGDRSAAARILGISLATLYRKKQADSSAAPLRRCRVYLLRNRRAGAVKIGYSYSPQVREATLQAEEPDVELLAYYSGNRLDEATLHRRFAEKRVRGEWFALTEQDLTDIREYFEPLPY